MTSTDRPVKRPSFQWYPGDAQRDTALRSCSLEARGLWREMMDLMHDGEPYGFLTAGGVPIGDAALASLCGISTRKCTALLVELDTKRVCSRTEEGVIYSRRMVRDEHNRTVRAAGGPKSQQNENVPRPKDGGKDTFDPSLRGSPAVAVCSLRLQTKKPVELEAGEAFDALRSKLEAVGDLKHMPPDTITALPDVMRKALSKIGGHTAVKRTPADKLVWLRRDFVKAYAAIAQAGT